MSEWFAANLIAVNLTFKTVPSKNNLRVNSEKFAL